MTKEIRAARLMPWSLSPSGKTDDWKSFKVVIKIRDTTHAFIPSRE